jgi:hypothetical protein
MSALNELEAFQDGLSSPFWQHFAKHVAEQWGPSGLAFQQMYQAGITAKNWEQVVAANEIQKAMAAMLAYPHERVQQLKAHGLRELVTERQQRGGA